MKRIFFVYIFAITFLYRCANPVMPTGGPADTSPPKLVSQVPENGTTLFKDKEILFEFNEYIRQQSFKQAFRIEPDLGINYSVSFSGKKVKVKLKSELPKDVTLIAKIGTTLSDFKGNMIKSPLNLAFSTGEIMNSGQLKVRFVNALDGKKVENAKLVLFKKEQQFDEKAFYVGEPDSAGNVTFSYLPSGDYKLVALEDINRNRMVDSFEWVQPSYDEYVSVYQDSSIQLKSIYYSKPDTIAPTLEGVGVFAFNRLRLRFSEPVFIISDSLFQVYSESDSISFRFLYSDFDDPSVYWAISEKGFSEVKEYFISNLDLYDAFRNHLIQNEYQFSSDLLSDTTKTRLIEVKPDENLFSDESAVAIFNHFVPTEVLDSLRLVEQEKLIQPYLNAKIDANKLIIYPPERWDEALLYQIRVFNPATQNFFTYSPKIKNRQDLSSLEITRTDSLTYDQSNWIIEIFNDTFYKRLKTNELKVIITDLPEESISLRAFADTNENDKWDSGDINPYRKPESFFFQSQIPLKMKMTTTIEVEF